MEITDTYIREYKKRSKTRFWAWAKVGHTYPRLHEECNKLRIKYEIMFGKGKFVRFRRYKYTDEDGNVERRKTIEIEI